MELILLIVSLAVGIIVFIILVDMLLCLGRIQRHLAGLRQTAESIERLLKVEVLSKKDT